MFFEGQVVVGNDFEEEALNTADGSVEVLEDSAHILDSVVLRRIHLYQTALISVEMNQPAERAELECACFEVFLFLSNEDNFKGTVPRSVEYSMRCFALNVD